MRETPKNKLQILKNLKASLHNKLYYFAGNFRAGLLGVQLGTGAKVSPKANIIGAYYIGAATIAKDVTLGEGSYISSGFIFSGKIGKWCSIGYETIIGPSEHLIHGITTSPTLAVKLGLTVLSSTIHLLTTQLMFSSSNSLPLFPSLLPASAACMSYHHTDT